MGVILSISPRPMAFTMKKTAFGTPSPEKEVQEGIYFYLGLLKKPKNNTKYIGSKGLAFSKTHQKSPSLSNIRSYYCVHKTCLFVLGHLQGSTSSVCWSARYHLDLQLGLLLDPERRSTMPSTWNISFLQPGIGSRSSGTKKWMAPRNSIFLHKLYMRLGEGPDWIYAR